VSGKFEELSVALTARKGNHPLLWLVLGGCAALAAVSSELDGETVVSVPRLWRALHGMPIRRFEVVRFASEPFVFVFAVTVFAMVGSFAIAVGVTSLRYRATKRGKRHPLSGVVER
jgi:hypothetical protein